MPTAAAFILALVTAALLTPIIRRVAHQVGALDYAHCSRKVHGLPVPRLGGMAIVLAFYATLIALLFIDTSVAQLFRADPRHAAGIFVGGTAIAALGIYDDLWGTGARSMFAVQFAVAGLVYALGYRIDEISNPFGDTIHLGWFGLPLTLLWIAGVVNAINLLDGLDGLAGGVALVSVGVTFVLSVMHGEPLMALVSAALAGGILGFLPYNFNPASIFMGDTGSMFLGFVLATSSIASHYQKSSTALTVLVPVVALGLPIADTLLAIVRRALRGAPLFVADRDHIHHRLLGLGLSHRQTVLAMYGASVVLGAAALALASSTRWLAWAIVGALALALGLLLRRLGYLQFERAREVLEQRRRNLELRDGMREAGQWLLSATKVDDVWAAVKSAADMLGAGGVELVVGRAVRGARRSRRYEHGVAGRDGALVTRHSLRSSRASAGRLDLVWAPGQAAIDRDTEIAIETLCDHLRSALQRIQAARGGPLPNPLPAAREGYPAERHATR
jgi:UDP-GlcNAc:undecaprenyl-phosphate GlcNAc-1-phosphate transferase